MALTYQGALAVEYTGSSGTGDQQTLDISSLSPATGDLAVVGVTCQSSGPVFDIGPLAANGYTRLCSATSDDGIDTTLIIFYKILEASETSIVVSTGASGSPQLVVIAQLYRDADPVNPIDVSYATAGGGNNTTYPASILPISTGAIVAVFGGTQGNGQTGSGYSNFIQQTGTAGSAAFNSSGFAGTLSFSGSRVDPPAITSTSGSDVNDSWASVTLAIRPSGTGNPAPVFAPVVRTFVDNIAGSTMSGTSGSSTAAVPSDIKVHDILVLVVQVDNTTDPLDLTLTTPSGWTAVGPTEITGKMGSRVFWKRVTRYDLASVTVAWTSSNQSGGRIQQRITVVRGAKRKGNPIEAYAIAESTTTTTTCTGATVTTLGSDRLLLSFTGTSNSGTLSYAAPWSESLVMTLYDIMGVSHTHQNSAGLSTAETRTHSVASVYVNWTLAFIPREDELPAFADTPISLVGSTITAHTTTTALSLTGLTGGSDSSPSADDVALLVAMAVDSTVTAPTLPGGWTSLVDQTSTDLYPTQLIAAYRVMTGAEADVTLTWAERHVIAVIVFRGVDTSNPIDVTTTTDVVTGSTANAPWPKPPNITPVTLGAMMVGIGASHGYFEGTPFTSEDLFGFISAIEPVTTVEGVLGLGYRSWDGAGEEDFIAWEGGTAGYNYANASNSAATIALRPLLTKLVGEDSGATSNIGGAANQEHLYRIAATASGTVAKLHLQSPAGTTGGGLFKLTLRADDSGNPGVLMATTAEITELGGANTYSVPVTTYDATIISGSTYWLGVHGDSGIETVTFSTANALKRGRLTDTYSDGTDAAPGAYTNLDTGNALRIWATGVEPSFNIVSDLLTEDMTVSGVLVAAGVSNIVLTDNLTADAIAYLGDLFLDTLADSVTAGDAISAFRSVLVTSTESFTAAVTVGLVSTFGATIEEGVEISYGLVVISSPHIRERMTLVETIRPAITYGVAVSDATQVSEVLRATEFAVLAEALTASDAVTRGLLHRPTVSEGITITPAVVPNVIYLGALADAASLVDAISRAEDIELSDALTASIAASAQYLAQATVAEGLTASIEVTPGLTLSAVVTDGAEISDSEILQMTFAGTLSENIEVFGGLVAPNGSITTWALNTRTSAVSEYQNYAFNSFAKMGGRYLAASESGLYELVGDDDDGVAIPARLKGGFLQFGGTRQSRLKAAYLAQRGEGNFVLKVTTGEGVEYVYQIEAVSGRNNRFVMGKGQRARYFSWELTTLDGQDFDLDTLEFVPVVLERRV